MSVGIVQPTRPAAVGLRLCVRGLAGVQTQGRWACRSWSLLVGLQRGLHNCIIYINCGKVKIM